jgi:hypothetical protein
MGVGNSYQNITFQVRMDLPVVSALNVLKKKGVVV